MNIVHLNRIKTIVFMLFPLQSNTITYYQIFFIALGLLGGPQVTRIPIASRLANLEPTADSVGILVLIVFRFGFNESMTSLGTEKVSSMQPL